MRRTAVLATWLGTLGACTPLGVWLYEEPAFEVSRVRLAAEQATDSIVMVALYVWNPNDYDLLTSRLDLRLELDGEMVGRFERDSIIPVPPSGTASVSLPFQPVRGGRLAMFFNGVHRFEIEGQAVFQTPFGDRRVSVAHAGDMAFGGAAEPVTARGGSEPRPGLSPPNRWPSVWRIPEPRSTR